MTHLSYDELFKLANTAAGDEGFDDDQIQQLEHLKTCKECYEVFCLLSTLADVVGVADGYSAEAAAEVQESVSVLKAKVLATISFVKKSAAEMAGAVMEQIDQAAASLQFGPALTVATRGGSAGESSAIRLEEYEDEKTYLVYQPENKELRVQINTRNLDGTVHVYLTFENSERVEVPLTQKGKLLQGSMSDIPEGNFSISIEAE